MKRTKKIFAFILAVLFLMPCAVLFSGCTLGGKEETTEAEWTPIIMERGPYMGPEESYFGKSPAFYHTDEDNTYRFSFDCNTNNGSKFYIKFNVTVAELLFEDTGVFNAAAFNIRVFDKNKNDISNKLHLDFPYRRTNHIIQNIYELENVEIDSVYYVELKFNMYLQKHTAFEFNIWCGQRNYENIPLYNGEGESTPIAEHEETFGGYPQQVLADEFRYAFGSHSDNWSGRSAELAFYSKNKTTGTLTIIKDYNLWRDVLIFDEEGNNITTLFGYDPINGVFEDYNTCLKGRLYIRINTTYWGDLVSELNDANEDLIFKVNI